MAYHLLHRNRQRLIVMSAHLDYRNYAVYLPRGYDPNSFKLIDTDGDGQPNPVTDTARIQKVDAASGRDEAVDAAIDYGRLHAGTPSCSQVTSTMDPTLIGHPVPRISSTITELL